MLKFEIKTKQDTKNFAQKFARQLKGGEIIALVGDLGAGKTFITQQIARFFKIKDRVASPTFVLMKIYEIKHSKFKIRNLVHVDCYRLDDAQELFYLGLEEFLNRPDTVVIIEWADKIKRYLKKFKNLKWLKIIVKGYQRTIYLK